MCRNRHEFSAMAALISRSGKGFTDERTFSRLGQFDPETAPLIRSGIHAQGTFHSKDSFLNDGQADAGTGILLRRVEPLEDLEDTISMLRSDPDAVVFHR